MRNVFKWSLMALAIVLIVYGCGAPPEERPSPRPNVRSSGGGERTGAFLSLSLELDKDIYTVGETIRVRVSLTNGTSRALRVVTPSLVIRSLRFVITDDRGRVLRYIGSVADVGITNESGKTIRPGRSTTVIYRLTGRYNFDSPPNGHYTIKGIYRFSQPGTSLWTGSLESETSTFSIVE